MPALPAGVAAHQAADWDLRVLGAAAPRDPPVAALRHDEILPERLRARTDALESGALPGAHRRRHDLAEHLAVLQVRRRRRGGLWWMKASMVYGFFWIPLYA